MANAFDNYVATPTTPAGNPFDALVEKPPNIPTLDKPTGFFNEMASNVIPSAVNLGKNIVTPFVHPVDTATNLAHLALGAGEKLIPGQQIGDEKYANALGSYFANRYGGFQNIRNTAATDPIGMLADITVPLTGSASLLARAPSYLGRTGEVLANVGRATDPALALTRGVGNTIRAAANAGTSLAGRAATEALGSNTATGAGANAINLGFQAGRAGGNDSAAFLGSLRRETPMDDPFDQAKAALANMRAQRNAAYRSGMLDVSKDATVLDFKPIDQAVADANEVKTYRGQSGTSPPQELSPSTTAVRQQMQDAIDHWKSLDPAEFHTPEGMDKLKQQLGDIKDAQPYHSPQSVVANGIYSSVRKAISDQVPVYSKVMQDYTDASDSLSELQRELSLGPKGNPNTALKKLQSAVRDNVNTGFGKRMELANELANNGAPTLMPSLAGQALSSIAPRGLAGIGGAGAAVISALMGHPYALAALPFTSPRLVGEGAHALGSIVGNLPRVPSLTNTNARLVPAVANQIARLSNPQPVFGSLAGISQ